MFTLTRPLIVLSLVAPMLADQPMTDRITPEQLAARTQKSPMEALPQPKSPDEVKVKNASDQSILRSSDILNDGSHWTLVPKGALLHTPASLVGKVTAAPAGQLLSWPDFLAANRSWITTEEVTMEQAAGKTTLQPEHSAYWPKQGKVVVAVHLGGPISVRPAAPATSTASR